MRILFLTPEVPYPPDSGGRLKTFTLLDYLSRRHEVTLAAFRRRPLDPAQSRWLAEFPRFRTLPLNRGRDARTLVRSYLSKVPLSIERNRTPAMAAVVAEELRQGSHECVFVDHWLMAQYLPEDYGGLRILHEHNAEHVMWDRQAARSRNPLVKREAARVRKYEAALLPRFDRIFAVSEADREALIDLAADPRRIDVLPNIPDPALLEMPDLSFSDSQSAVLYIGTLSWQPNIDGLERFMAGVLPLVRERDPSARFLIAGRDAPRRLADAARLAPGVDYLGRVDETEPLYGRARVFVEATTTGGGTRLKILNAMARGLPVVSSPQAAEGLETTNGESIVIAADDGSMSEAILRLMSDEAHWTRIAAGGRSLVRQRYVADVAYRPLDEVLSGVPARS